jgi:hypothetical protein
MSHERGQETEQAMLLEALITQGCTVEAAQLIVRGKVSRDDTPPKDAPAFPGLWCELPV